MPLDMVERIRQLMAHKELSSTQFADTLEVPRATVSHILSERNKPSLDVVLKIISTFREVSLAWLLLGEGEMLPGVPAAEPPVTPEAAKKDGQAATEPGPPPPALPVAPGGAGKQVEQVVVFYSDKTFTAYAPS